VRSSHRLQLPFRVSPIRNRCFAANLLGRNPGLLRSAPSEAFCPYSVYQSRGATYPGEYPTHPVTFCALGFLTPSTRCSPHDLPGLFHPGSAHGVNPSRLYSSSGVVWPFRPPQPSWSWPESLGRLVPPAGCISPEKTGSKTWGLARRLLAFASLGFFLDQVSCLLRCSPPVWRRSSPLTFSRTGLHAHQPADASGF
jgi:hypothetical protein